MEPNMILYPNANLNNIYNFQLTITIKDFKIGPYVEMQYSYAGWLCFNIGWRTDQIDLLFVLAMTFENCYKNII